MKHNYVKMFLVVGIVIVIQLIFVKGCSGQALSPTPSSDGSNYDSDFKVSSLLTNFTDSEKSQKVKGIITH